MLQSEVILEPISHTYKGVSDGRIYDSVSKVLNSVEEEVDWWKIAGKVAGKGKFKHLPTQQEVFDFWKANGKEAMDHGTDLHSMQERYSKEFKILPEDIKYEKGIKHIASMFKNYYRSEDEACVYSREFGVAGTMDKCLFVSKGSKLVDLVDYKTALKTDAIDFVNKDNKFLKYPVSHLQHCKFSRYSLQLSIYGLLAEECCGLIIRGMWIVFIPTDYNVLPYKIYVPYLRNDAFNVLDNYSHKPLVVDYVDDINSDLSTTIPTFEI